mmetsp:Transcript_46201/g.128841  ORF Transcript_46201/g.128841 Transcript_46201/m.128841 type:complete len:144 (+) Transcript_46201:747-1178(+)
MPGFFGSCTNRWTAFLVKNSPSGSTIRQLSFPYSTPSCGEVKKWTWHGNVSKTLFRPAEMYLAGMIVVAVGLAVAAAVAGDVLVAAAGGGVNNGGCYGGGSGLGGGGVPGGGVDVPDGVGGGVGGGGIIRRGGFSAVGKVWAR